MGDVTDAVAVLALLSQYVEYFLAVIKFDEQNMPQCWAPGLGLQLTP